LGLLCDWVVAGGGMTPKDGCGFRLSLGAAVGVAVGVPELSEGFLSGCRKIASASPPASTIIAITPISSTVWPRDCRPLSEAEVV
jgi:hypothetical protein